MNSIDDDEITKFSKISNQWWDENGKFKPLHIINSLRVSYVVENIRKNIDKEMSDIFLVDIGCGGGLLTEPMARIGINVLGIDPSQQNINVAKDHAVKSQLDINYLCTSAEDLVKNNKKYDVVLVMEVVEHVNNLSSFVESCSKLVNDGGIIVISTINRTIKSLLFAIIGAEYILRWLPIGTHNWKKFVTPAEIAEYLRVNNVSLKEIKGMNYNLFGDEWQLTDDPTVNYLVVGKK